MSQKSVDHHVRISTSGFGKVDSIIYGGANVSCNHQV